MKVSRDNGVGVKGAAPVPDSFPVCEDRPCRLSVEAVLEPGTGAGADPDADGAGETPRCAGGAGIGVLAGSGGVLGEVLGGLWVPSGVLIHGVCGCGTMRHISVRDWLGRVWD